MKRLHPFKHVCAGLLATVCLMNPSGVAAQLIQPDRRQDAAFTVMRFDPNVEGQIYAFAYDGAQAFVSNDNGVLWRLAIDFDEYYKGTEISNGIKEIKPGKDPDVLFIRPLSNDPAGQGIFSVNHKTGKIRHYSMPDTGIGDAWIESFDVYDEEGDILIADVKYRIDLTTICSTVYRTSDGGDHWIPVSSNFETDFVYPAKVAFAPDNSDRLYIFRGSGPAGPQGGILISDDNGQTWHETLSGYPLGAYAFNPLNPDEIYVATECMFDDEALLRSTDGGESWERQELPFRPYILDYIIDMAFDPRDPNNLIILEEDQIFSTSDDFMNFAEVTPDGYCWGTGVSINPYDSDDIIIGIDMQGIMRSGTRLQTSDITSSFALDLYCDDVAASGPNVYTLRNGICGRYGSAASFGDDYTAIFADSDNEDSVFAYSGSADRLDRISFSDATTTVLVSGKGAPRAVASAGNGRYAVLIGSSLYSLDLGGASPILTDTGIEDAVTLAGDGSILYSAIGSKVMTSSDGIVWHDFVPLSGITSISTGGGRTAAITGSGLFILNETATEWIKADGIGFSPECVAVDGDVIVVREPLQEGLVAVRYSKDGGLTWNKADEKEFGFAHADRMCLASDADGAVNVCLASSDMGLLFYPTDYEPQTPPEPPTPACGDVRMLNAEITSAGACLLSWVSPEGHYNANYNIYRDDVKIADGIAARDFEDSFLTPGQHVWRVTTIYDSGESAGTETAALYTGETAPVREAVVDIVNMVDGNAVATVSWALPDNYDRCVCNIYRDGVLVADDLEGLSYSDRNLSGGIHTWEIAVNYGSAESERVAVSAEVVNECAPVRGLEGYFDLDDRCVHLEWEIPGDLPAPWITRCGSPAGAYGLTELNQYDIAVANRWTAAELEQMGLTGSRISDISFVPMAEKAAYFGRVWIGTDADGQPEDEYLFGNLEGKDACLGEWNTLTSDRVVELPEGKDLWVGVCVRYAGGISPVGIDGDPIVERQNYCRDSSASPFSLREDSEEHASGNFCLGVRVMTPDGEPMRIASADKVDGISYEISRDGEIIGNSLHLTFTEGELAERGYTYAVRAVYSDKGASPLQEVEVFAGNKCPRPSDLKVSEQSGEVSLSWKAAAPQPVDDVVFNEGFDGFDIPAGWMLTDCDGDGQNWYVMHYNGPDGNPDPNGFLCSDMSCYVDDSGFQQLSPDNWIISPEIRITGSNPRLDFYVSATGMYSNQSYYEVLVSTTGTDIGDFAPVICETLDLYDMIWLKKTVYLGEYSGKIHLALRHRNDAGESMGLFFDNISLTQQVDKDRIYNVYRDGMLVSEGVSGPAFIDEDCAPGEHTWVVTTVCDEYACESDPLSVRADVSGSGIRIVDTVPGAIYYDGRHSTIVATGDIEGDTVDVYGLDGILVDSVTKDAGCRAEVFTFGYNPGIYIVRCGEVAAKIRID